MAKLNWKSRVLAGACSAALVAMAFGVKAQQAPPAAGAAGGQGARGGGAGGRGGSNTGALLFTAFDANKDGAVTRDEMKATFDAWYAAADTAKAGSATQAQLSEALNAAFPAPEAAAAPPGGGAPAAPGGARGGGGGRAVQEFVAGASTPGLNDPCGGRSQTPTVACPDHVTAMMAALPSTAPAKPATARKVLIFSRIPSAGFQHSSIPLAAKAVEELGKKTGAWTSDTSWDPAVFTTENLKQYDAIFLSSTTGCFLDKAGDKATTDARRAAFIQFVRERQGRGRHPRDGRFVSLAVSRTTTRPAAVAADSDAAAPTGPGGTLASVILRWSWGLNDKKLQANDQTLTKADMEAVSDGWYNELDTEKAGKVTQANFATRIVPVGHAGQPVRRHGRPRQRTRLLARLGQHDRRVVQVPLARPAEDHRQDRRQGQPADEDVQRPGLRRQRRDVHVQRQLLLPRERSRADEHQLRQDELHRQAQGEQSAARS